MQKSLFGSESSRFGSNLDVVLAINRMISSAQESTVQGTLHHDQYPRSPSHEAGINWRQDVTSTVTEATLFGEHLPEPSLTNVSRAGPYFSLAAGRKKHQELRIARSPSPKRTHVPQGIPAWIASDAAQHRSQTNESAEMARGCKQRWLNALQKDASKPAADHKGDTILQKVLAKRHAEYDISEIESRIAHFESTRAEIVKAENAFSKVIEEPLHRRLVTKTDSDSSCIFTDSELDAELRQAQFKQQIQPHGQRTDKAVERAGEALVGGNRRLPHPASGTATGVGSSDLTAARVLNFFHA